MKNTLELFREFDFNKRGRKYEKYVVFVDFDKALIALIEVYFWFTPINSQEED